MDDVWGSARSVRLLGINTSVGGASSSKTTRRDSPRTSMTISLSWEYKAQHAGISSVTRLPSSLEELYGVLDGFYPSRLFTDSE